MADGAASRPTTRRPGGRTARVRARVLAATAELVARCGVAGFGYEDVAKAAGVHKTTIYRNWPDRDTLVSETMLAAAEDMMPITDTGDLRQDLVDFLMALAESLASPEGRALSQAVRSAQEEPATRRTVAAIFERRVALMRRRVDSAVEDGELPPVDGYFFIELLSGPVHAYVTRGLRPFTRADAERIVDVVLTGLRHTAS